MTTAMLSFKLGPVQPFIEAARTLRDLWSGSYLLSWLTAHAMKPIIEKYGYDSFVTPHVSAENPLVRAVMNKTPTKDEATLACLPHTFAAVVPAENAGELKEAVVKAAVDEWKQIAKKVKEALDPIFRTADKSGDWAMNWQDQIDSYFEFTCVVLDLKEADEPKLAALGVKEDKSQDDVNKLWGQQWNLQQALLDLARMVRHVPPYLPKARDHKFPVKCSLLGSFEQVGPAEVRAAREFWEAVSQRQFKDLPGTRLQPNDKLCSISLVKRFAWPAYWMDKLDLKFEELRFSDTATLAATKWLAFADEKRDIRAINPDSIRKKHRKWNGQWLHWPKPSNGEDEDCPPDVWAAIQEKKRKHGAVPTYFAFIHLDGDNMGEIFQGEVGKQFGFGRERFREVTQRLTGFALEQVKRIVEREHNGELIYTGGDDVLAFLPTESAIECAHDLREAFGKALPGATLSGGIAVVHYKEDLRFALGQVRAAEKVAKQIGKANGDPGVKDALALTVCKRSGEHATAVMGWDEADQLQNLIELFKTGASDRWTYKLRDEVDRLVEPRDKAKIAWNGQEEMLLALGRAEAVRLVERGEFAAKTDFRAVIEQLFDAYKGQMTKPARRWPAWDVLSGFVTLVQAASFLARGKE